MSTQLSRLITTALPAANSHLTYNKERNILLSNGYTSAAGNTYYQGIRLSDRIIVVYNIGQGYCRTFLNGIDVYGFDGNKRVLLGSRSYDCWFFNETSAKREATEIVSAYLKDQARITGACVEPRQIEEFSRSIIQDTEDQLKRLN